jgi:hypothetical protein
MTTLIECIIMSGVLMAPFFSMMYSSILLVFDTVADWMKGDTDDIQG